MAKPYGPDVRIEINKEQLSRVKANVVRGKEELADFSGPHKRIAVFLDRWVQRNFKQEGKLVGGWKPLKLGGRFVRKGRGKRVFDTGARILQDTGALRLSHIPFASRSNAGIGSDLKYAKTHDEGIGVPRRRTLPEKRDVQDDVKKIFDGHVKEFKKTVR